MEVPAIPACAIDSFAIGTMDSLLPMALALTFMHPVIRPTR